MKINSETFIYEQVFDAIKQSLSDPRRLLLFDNYLRIN